MAKYSCATNQSLDSVCIFMQILTKGRPLFVCNRKKKTWACFHQDFSLLFKLRFKGFFACGLQFLKEMLCSFFICYSVPHFAIKTKFCSNNHGFFYSKTKIKERKRSWCNVSYLGIDGHVKIVQQICTKTNQKRYNIYKKQTK